MGDLDVRIGTGRRTREPSAADARLVGSIHRPQALSARAVVSVVVACYNYGRYLPQAVRSALTQEGVDVEVVVVDDKSTDDSLEVARTLAAHDDRVRVIASDENGGAVAAFNRGLAAATGEFVVRLDADDLLTPGSLARAVAVMQAHPRVGLVYGHPLHFDDGPLPKARLRPRSWTIWRGPDWMAQRCVHGSNVITSPEVVLRRSVVDDVGGLRPLAHTHDMEWWLRVATAADVAYIRGVDQAWHREHPGSLSTAAEDPMQILPEILDAFDEVFRTTTMAEPRRTSLQAAYRRAVAETALSFARTHLDRGRRGSPADDLLALAARIDPTITGTPGYRRASRSAGEPPRRTTALRGTVPRARRRVADRIGRRRWARTGVYERMSLRRASGPRREDQL